MAKRGKSLKKILAEYSKSVQEAAVKALNENAEMLQKDIEADMQSAGIQSISGKLKASIEVNEANMKNLDATVKSEVYADLPKEPNKRNAEMYYPPKGVPYGRLIEFSPRINKPFFYTSFYKKKRTIIEDVFKACREAGKK